MGLSGTARRRSPLPADWPRRRKYVLERDAWQCKLRTPALCTFIATEVDHVGAHDDHALQHLQAVCSQCHAHKTAIEAQRARPTVKRQPEAHPGVLHVDPATGDLR